LGECWRRLKERRRPSTPVFDVEPVWPNHLRFFDGGLFAHWTALSGFDLKPAAAV
jgi:hypothetical protein